MGRYILGTKLNAFPSGLTDTLAAGVLRARRTGAVIHPGRIVALGAFLGANGAAINKIKLGAHLLDPGTLDPTMYLTETNDFSLQTLWTADDAGGTNIEADTVRVPTMAWYQPWFWYKADALALADGAKVVSWIDASGNGRTVSNSLPAEQPTFRTNRRNGLPIVEFNGSTTDLTAIGANLPKPCSIYFALRTPISQASSGRVYSGNSNTILGRLNVAPGNAILQAGVAYIYATGLPAANWEIHSHIYNGTDSIGVVNGGAWVPGNVGVLGTVANFTLGSSTNAEFVEMELGELVAFPGAHDNATRYIIEGILANKWGIALDPSHLYANDLPVGYPPVVLAGQEIVVDVVGSGSLRLPSRFFLGGKKWEETSPTTEPPALFVPTSEVLDDREVSSYAVIEENRPPVVTDMVPSGGEVVIDVTPDFSLTTTDPDRTEGLNDYPTSVIVRVWEKFKGSLQDAGSRVFPLTIPADTLTPVNIGPLTWSLFDPKVDLGARMSTYLPARGTTLNNLDPVTTLFDNSGNDNNGTQTNSLFKPVYKTNQINTYPAIDFDGNDDYLSVPITASSIDEAVFAVVKVDSFANTPTILGTNNTGARWLAFDTTGHLFLDRQNIMTLGKMTGAASTGTWTIIRSILTPNMLRLGLHGTSVENFVYDTAFSPNRLTLLGTDAPAASHTFDGLIADLIVMKASDLRPGDEERIVGSLAHFYGLTGPLAATFTYKTLQPGLRASLAAPVDVVTNRLEDMPNLTPNALVSSWTDVGISAQNATQATVTNKPIYRANRINGHGAVDFDGTDNYLTFPPSAGAVNEAIFAVIYPDVTLGTKPILGPTLSGGRLFQINAGFLEARGINTLGTSSPLGIALRQWSVVGVVMRASGVRYCINGTWTIPNTGLLTMTAGATSRVGTGDALANFFDGQIATIIRLPASSLGVDGADRWIGRLAWQYGLQAKLPESHPFRFAAPTDVVEHHWTAEVRDRFGGISGTGYGARLSADELPDGSTEFNVSLAGYAVGITPLGKVATQTPIIFSVTYNHPLGRVAVGKKIRLLKKNSSGQYVVDQTSPLNVVSAASGTTVIFTWFDTEFEPLAIGGDYVMEWKFTDANGDDTAWTGRSDFHVNYTPSPGTIVTPTSPAAVTGLPLILFSLDDADDDGVSYFGESPVAIHELNIGSSGSANGQFGSLSQINLGPDGHLWIVDPGNDRVQKMNSSTGAYITKITLAGMQVFGVVVEPDGDVYISYRDPANGGQIKRFSSAGVLLETSAFINDTPRYLTLDVSSEILFTIKRPNGYGLATLDTLNIATHPISSEANVQDAYGIATDALGNYVWIVDQAGDAVWRYDGVGNTEVWGSTGWGPGEFRSPTGIAIHPITGNFWVTDTDRHTVMEFTHEGEFLREFGGYGTTNGKFDDPVDVTISADGAYLYVADRDNRRVQKFRIALDADLLTQGVEGEVAIGGPIEIINQDFDFSLSGWAYAEFGSFAQTTVVSGESPVSGAGFARITFTAGPNHIGAISAFTFFSPPVLPLVNTFPVVEGEVYTVSAYFRRNSEDFYGQIGIRWFDIDDTSFSVSYGKRLRPITGVWEKGTVSGVAPENAVRAAPILVASVGVAAPTYPVSVDWDQVEIGSAIRYVRGATFLAGDAYDYQFVSADMPIKGSYTVMARGKDGTSTGPWSAPIVIDYIDGPTATILSPTPGQVFNTATPTFLWQLTGGEQWAYKIEVLDILGVLQYDSGWIQGIADRSHVVPSGYLVDGGSYFGRIWLDDGKVQVLV